MENRVKVIISGGGTGGHIFPAVSIANAIKEACPEAELLFIGAQGRMEMQRVPAAGYEIIGLPVAGFDRKNLLKNIPVLFKLVKSHWKAYRIIRNFNPQLAIGVGGYASGPTLKMAGIMGIPTLLQEQNSYAGVTNKLLAGKAKKICVAYPDMERFFPAEKIILTGNPVRQDLLNNSLSKEACYRSFNLDPSRKTLLLVGGSLGARTLNNSVLKSLKQIREREDVQVIWQTGKIYSEQVKRELAAFGVLPQLYVTDFISNMNAAYSVADLVISRAGAGSISEFCLLGKPVILIPSPNVAEDHQTKNALALVTKEAALYVKDSEAEEKLIPYAYETLFREELLDSLSRNILKLALPDSAGMIAQEAFKLITAYHEQHRDS